MNRTWAISRCRSGLRSALEARREAVRKDAWRLYQKFVEATEQHLQLSLNRSKPSDAAALAKVADILWRIAVGDVSPSELTGYSGNGNPVPRSGVVPIINVIIREGEETKKAERLAGTALPNGRN
jgi:hypothetical protein